MEWSGDNKGPGWQDVADMIQALESLHGCSACVNLSVASWYGQPRFMLSAIAYRASEVNLNQPLQETATAIYPNASHKSLSGTLYNLLHMLDRNIQGSWYEQRKLPLD